MKNGKPITSYQTWYNILSRCYGDHSINPTYAECSICDEWIYFSNFKDWFDINYVEGFHLDKDILTRGNKIYAPVYCRYIPQHINTLLIHKRTNKGDYPSGVNRHGRKFQASISKHGKRFTIGTFNTPEEAESAYIKTKESHIKEVAIEAFLNNEILSDIASELINYKITIRSL